jgi:hypothetical protein
VKLFLLLDYLFQITNWVLHECLTKSTRQSSWHSAKARIPVVDGGEDDELVTVIDPPLRHLQRQDDVTILDIVVVKRARHDEFQ